MRSAPYTRSCLANARLYSKTLKRPTPISIFPRVSASIRKDHHKPVDNLEALGQCVGESPGLGRLQASQSIFSSKTCLRRPAEDQEPRKQIVSVIFAGAHDCAFFGACVYSPEPSPPRFGRAFLQGWPRANPQVPDARAGSESMASRRWLIFSEESSIAPAECVSVQLSSQYR